jgi:outer membrane receptor for ferrienterochelin and colicins
MRKALTLLACCITSGLYAQPMPYEADTAGVVNLDQIVVTGTRTKKTLSNTPVVTRVISSLDMQRLDATDIKDVLVAELPGVEFTYSMNQQVTINMQGFGGMSVLFLIDGERMAGETLDNIDFQRLNIDDIERVEVVKGAASALYGSNSVGALVNIITKTHSEPWQAHLDAHVGSRNGEQRYGGAFSFNNKKWTNFLNLQQSSFDSYKVYDKGRSDSTQIFGSRQYNVKDKLIYAINERQKLIARGGYYFRERNMSPDDKDRAKDISAGLKYTADLGLGDNLEIGYTFDRYDKSDYYPSTGDDIMDYRNMQNSLRALYVRHFDDSFSLTFGGDGMVDYLKSYQFQEDGSHSQTTADLFVQSDWEIGKHWELIGGLRTDYFSKYGWELTPKVSAMYRVGEFRLRGGYAKGFRAPTLKEMYMNFNMADIFNIYGNTDLESEKTHSFSASAEYSWGSYNAVISGYYNLIDNEITTIWDASLDNGRGAMHYVNVGGTNLASADATVTARYPFGLGWKLSYAFFHEFTRNDAPNTSDSRPHSLTWQASYHQKYRKYYWEVTINGRHLSDADFHTYNSGSYTSYVKTHSPGYQVWRLSLMQRFWRGVTLTAIIDNIFNYKPDEYQYNSLFTQGTTFLFTLAVDIEKFFKK